MNRVFVIALIVGLVWAGAEIFTKGTDGAFGGVLTGRFDAPAGRSTPDRAADAFQRAYDRSETRVDRALERSHESAEVE